MPDVLQAPERAFREAGSSGGDPLPEQVPSDRNLCKSCGLCCDGTLFASVGLGRDENVDGLEARGAEFEVENKKRRLALPCVAYEECICKVYEERPVECRKFECELLKRFLRDEVTWGEAVELIDKAKLQRQRVEAALSRVFKVPDIKPLGLLLKSFIESHGDRADTAAFRKEYGDIILQYLGLDRYLDRYFRHKS